MDGVALPDDEAEATVAQARPRTRSTVLVVVAALAVTMLVLGSVMGYAFRELQIPVEQPLRAGMSDYKPANAEERELFASLRKPTYSEASALSKAVGHAGLHATFQLYIATDHLVLPTKPPREVITIGVVPGITWVDGPLTNVRLVIAGGGLVLPLALRDGVVLYDRWCQKAMVSRLMLFACPSALPSATSEQAMHTQLRPLATKEFSAYPGLQHIDTNVPLEQGNVFLATGKVTLHPYLGVNAKIPVIVLGSGGQIVGGQFGKIQAVDARSMGKGRNQYELLHDPIYTATLARGMWPVDVCNYFSQPIKQRYPGACS